MPTTTRKSSVKPFLNEDFLLETPAAQELYHDYARQQPIIDYHNHLPPADIAGDRCFINLTKVWLDGDHYKWRAMRTLGINESFITGDADDIDKFRKWAEAVPFTIRNPLYHWTHLELKRYFGIDGLLTPDSADEIYEACSEKLRSRDFSTRNLLHKMKVETVCTTDDPIDDLKYHQELEAEDTGIKMFPAFRPDKAILIEKEGFPSYLQKLGEAADITIKDMDSLLEALQKRMDFFHENGCRLSDHGLERLYAEAYTRREADKILRRRLNGRAPDEEDAKKFASALLHELGKMYHTKGWVMQYHLGALRNNSSRMVRTLGPDTGFDSIGDWQQAEAMSRFFDRLDRDGQLTKTIIYNLNPADNEVFASMIGNFNDGSVRGKMQFGSGWWFLDQKDGMEKQMNALSNLGLLSCFIGMLTDSRSFLSFPRHEYFRRILCNLIGRDVQNGELPNDIPWLGEIVRDICYRNAKEYFGFTG